MKYQVEFVYYEPTWGDVELNSEEDVVKEEAEAYVRRTFPEAEDFEITRVTPLG